MASRRIAASVRVVLAALAGLVAVAAAGCDIDDGRTLRPPPPGATAPPMASETSTVPNAQGATVDNGVRLTSPAFADLAPLPDRYAKCGGDNVSPPLEWSGIPAGVVELAIVVVDHQAPSGAYYHWVVTGLSPDLVGLEEGAVPESAVEARNDSSEFGWDGPCPPEGETHDYVFTLYALTERTGLEEGVGAREAFDRIAVIPGYAATLTASYGR